MQITTQRMQWFMSDSGLNKFSIIYWLRLRIRRCHHQFLVPFSFVRLASESKLIASVERILLLAFELDVFLLQSADGNLLIGWSYGDPGPILYKYEHHTMMIYKPLPWILGIERRFQQQIFSF